MSCGTAARCSLGLMLIASLLLMVGCFESRYPLGQREAGKVDLRYVGNWILESRNEQGDTDSSRLLIRNLHNDEYYVEWIGGDDKALRFTGYTTDVDGVTFANLLPLTDDGKLAEKYTILRLDWDGDKLKIRVLDDDFFKDKKFDSSAALRSIVKANLNQEMMYDGDAIVGTKEGR